VLYPDQHHVPVGRDLQPGGARDDPRGLTLLSQAPDECPERPVVNGPCLRADDDQLVYRARAGREALEEDVLGLPRLGPPAVRLIRKEARADLQATPEDTLLPCSGRRFRRSLGGVAHAARRFPEEGARKVREGPERRS
jgi:hypothetical protein